MSTNFYLLKKIMEKNNGKNIIEKLYFLLLLF
nr:MAG TPA: hypothetical protein [Caudoviricetes sp.]